jgi:hypothetical protein
MMPITKNPQKVVPNTINEFKRGKLHSGKGGPVVHSAKQALAIALSRQRKLLGK